MTVCMVPFVAAKAKSIVVGEVADVEERESTCPMAGIGADAGD